MPQTKTCSKFIIENDLVSNHFYVPFFGGFCTGLHQVIGSGARINHDKRGRKKRQEALETAAEALQIFVEVNDRKFEAKGTADMEFERAEVIKAYPAIPTTI